MRLVCLTSNDYIKFVPAFCHYFAKNWGRQESVTVAGYEQAPSLPLGFSYFCIGKQSEYTWSSGLARLLNCIEDEWIVLFLEDYLISEPARPDLIDGLLADVIPQTGAVKVDLWATDRDIWHRRQYQYLCNYQDIEVYQQLNNWYLMSTWVALWDRKFLLSKLDLSEDPWQFERAATVRVGEPAGRFLGTDTDIVPIVNAHAGRTQPLPGEAEKARAMMEAVDGRLA